MERRLAVSMMKEGRASPAQVAKLAGVSRQLAEHWARLQVPDWEKRLFMRLFRYWHSRFDEGRAVPRKPTKAEQRRQAEKANRQWNARQREKRDGS